MTKRHFIALADMIRDHNQHSDYPFHPSQIESVADMCARENPAFDRARWLAYIAGDCGFVKRSLPSYLEWRNND